jgi:ATP-dependent protease ClpP protease subunit
MTHLLALAERGRKFAVSQKTHNSTGDWYRIVNADGDRAEMYIYGVIGSDWDPDDVTAGSFTRDLRAIKAPSIDLHINSPGGLVFDGVAIYSALLNHPATVDVFVDGIAASAASFVAMAGETITVEKPAKMMIHNSHGMVIGSTDDFREMADLLADLDGTIAEIYSDRAGGPVEKWREAMRAETWYSASEAVEAGLADRVANDTQASAPEDRRSQMIRARARLHLERV